MSGCMFVQFLGHRAWELKGNASARGYRARCNWQGKSSTSCWGSCSYCTCDSSALTLISCWAERPETKAQMAHDCAFMYFLAVGSVLWAKPLDVWPRLKEKRPA